MVSKLNRNRAIGLVLAIGLIVITSIYYNNSEDNSSKEWEVSLRQEWFPYAGYAGELIAVNETDEKYGLDIKLEAGSDNLDPIKLVLGGSNDFGVVSADRILTANEKGADLVVIGVINHASPTCFISKKEDNILEPEDFEGKRVGVLTGTNTEYVYKALKNKLSLNSNLITEVEISFDLGTFISGAYDVRPAFIYDETVSLDFNGISYRIIEPKDYDIHFLGTVYFTTRKILKEKPEVVEAFVKSMIEGWEKALSDPQKAIAYLKEYDPEIDANRELAAFQKGLDYFKGQQGKVLYAELKEWKEMSETLVKLGVLKEADLGNCINLQFVDKYYSEKQK
ncbi:ABC transporter substrate-binding protein [Croceimicrobium sp.]|uniref:ABC transporter substrate-binding protein n=1 Tax=Croceimicrobium sp. TaxID=2828340 RepID=UPI003BA8D6BB